MLDSPKKTKPLVSIIAPVYNEEDVIGEFIEQITKVIQTLAQTYDFEVILVDDGSSDQSIEVMRSYLDRMPHLKVIELSRNYGQTPALQAGLDQAAGEIWITMDSDLQHFPKEIPQFLEKIEAGYEMVCGWRKDRKEGLIRRWPSRVANWLLRKLAGLPIHDFGTTFRAYRRDLVKDMQLYGDFHRYIPFLGNLAGGKITEIPIQNISRVAGKSSYGISRTYGVSVDLFLLYFLGKYLDRPLRAFGKIGLLFFSVGFIIIATLVVTAYIYQVGMVREHSGWFILATIFIIASIQIFLTGILAEILVRIHFGQEGKRTYRIRQRWNLS